MKKDNKAVGKFGEDFAAKFLKRKGYEIIKRNYTNEYGEIDIIAAYAVVPCAFRRPLLFIQLPADFKVLLILL